MIEPEALHRQLQAMLNKSRKTLRVAERHLEEEEYDFTSSKAYYAVFHLMQAALLTKGMTYSKHKGVIGGFSQHFIKPGLFPEEFGKLIQRLRRDREVGDYGYEMTVTAEKAAQDVQLARRMTEAIEAYLKPFVS